MKDDASEKRLILTLLFSKTVFGGAMPITGTAGVAAGVGTSDIVVVLGPSGPVQLTVANAELANQLEGSDTVLTQAMEAAADREQDALMLSRPNDTCTATTLLPALPSKTQRTRTSELATEYTLPERTVTVTAG